jgi:hypothetical protein
MGPCVRLIRALGAQPEPSEEESQKQWAEFKDTVKGEGFGLREARIDNNARIRQSLDTSDYCFSGDQCTNIVVKSLSNPTIDDDKTLAGNTTLTYADGTTEPAAIHHTRRWFGVDTTILTRKKVIHLNGHCYHQRWFGKCSTQGTSMTTNDDGTRTLGVVYQDSVEYY